MDEARGEEATQSGQQQQCILSGEVYLRHRMEKRTMRAFRNSDKQNISELKPAKGIIFNLIEKWHFSRFCSLCRSVFWGSLKSFLEVMKCPRTI